MRDNTSTDNERPPTFAELRIRAGLTLARLADYAGYAHSSAVHAIERGTQHPQLTRARLLAQALGVSVEALAASIDESRRQHESGTVDAQDESSGE